MAMLEAIVMLFIGVMIAIAIDRAVQRRQGRWLFSTGHLLVACVIGCLGGLGSYVARRNPMETVVLEHGKIVVPAATRVIDAIGAGVAVFAVLLYVLEVVLLMKRAKGGAGGIAAALLGLMLVPAFAIPPAGIAAVCVFAFLLKVSRLPVVLAVRL